MLLTLFCAAASAWMPGEMRPLALPPADDLVLAPFDGSQALVITRPDGIAALDPQRGELWASSPDAGGRALLVADLDGNGASELLVCGSDGVAVVELGRQGVRSTRLAATPCERLVALDASGYPEIVALGPTGLTVWQPAITGLVRRSLPASLAAGSPLIGSGDRFAVVDAEQGLIVLDSRGVVLEDRIAGPVVAAAVQDGAFAVLIGGESPTLLQAGESLSLEGSASGLSVADGQLWLMDREGSRVGRVEGPEVIWFEVAVAPARLIAADLNGDACGDLILSDDQGAGAVIYGVCGGAVAFFLPPGTPLQIPGAPIEIPLGAPWPAIDVRVGEPVVSRVSGDACVRWVSRGGPPGFAVHNDGTIDFQAEPEDVGRWRVPVRGSGGSMAFGRWYGFELRIWPAEGTVNDAMGAGTSQVASHPTALGPGQFGMRHVWMGLGGAAGAARAGGSTLENLGQAPVRGGVSPLASLTVAIGSERFQLLLGGDSAPFLTYGAQPVDRKYVVAGLVGGQWSHGPTALGVYGTIGATVTGLGARVAWTGLSDWRGHPMGPEARALWLAPQLGGLGALSWSWAL